MLIHRTNNMGDDNYVAVTNFINPHLFWYKKIETPDEKLHVLTVIEESLADLYKNRPPCDNLRLEIGDKVAVNYVAWNKYIRAEILHKAEFQQGEYVAWALDYGFSLLTKKEYIRNLPSNLHVDIGYIRVGGIANIYPAEQEYDDLEGNLIMVKKDKWLQRACDLLEKLLADSNSISFCEHFGAENGHAWGDLIIVNHKGIHINAREYLLKTTNAVEEDDYTFKKNCSKFKSTKIAPWLSNNRNTKFKFNNIKHNYIEHSKQMNAALVDENAKRKVEDWQKRNERKKIEQDTETHDVSCELPEDYVDDVTFDDSVSVAHNQQLNYIGKAGILTKIKQQKYSSAKDLPPSAIPKAFEIEKTSSNWPEEQEQIHSAFGSHIENLSQLHIQQDAPKCINNEEDSLAEEILNSDNQILPLVDLESNSSLSKVCPKQRQRNLHEMRLKMARVEKDVKYKSTESMSMRNQNETNNSTSDSYPYQMLEQSSLTSSTLNSTTDTNIQKNQSDLSVNNVRVKHLIAMRKKLTSTNASSNNSRTNTISGYQEEKQDNMNKSGTKSVTELNFALKPKVISNAKDEIEESPQIYLSSGPSKTTTKERLKIAQSGFESHTLVPAGFDVTRLRTYKDEKNHWHRKKSTLNDYIPHDQTSSTDELLSNNTNDRSSSSLDLSPTSHLKGIKSFSQLQDSSRKCEAKNVAENYLSSELSTSSNTTVLKQIRKRRQLKSPTSQLSKIDQILFEHSVEKELGNKNILDLQLLNTSSSSQKTSSAKTSNISSCNGRVPCESDNIKNCSSQSSLSIDNVRNEKVYKEVSNYEASMDVKLTKYLPVVEGERKIQTKFIDHLVLAHSTIPLAPIENVWDAPFLPEIHEEMRQMRVNKVYRIQVYSWSHVVRNNSLFVVNPSRSGKTWSYLPPLCSIVCCRKDSFKPSYGPVAIILVASLKHVELVNNYCRRLMSGLKSEAPTCVPSFGMRNLIETKIHLLNGCGILVATPSNILRLLYENEKENLFDAERLEHIVIDDMDIMMSRSQRDFESAYSILFKMAKKSKYKKLSPQLIVTSRDWDGLMVKFIRNSNQPLLLIGDFLEAAVYGHATLSVKLKSNTGKNEAILKCIKEMSESAHDMDNIRTLILCNGDEDVQNVHKFLQECGYPSLGFYNRSTESERVTIDEWKKKISSQILVCTDARFCELKIQNVNNLIHYSMPTSWTQFTLRFSALARTYHNYVSLFQENNVSSIISATQKQYAHSMIFLDENNNLQLPRLVDFMHKHNQRVQDEIQMVSKRVLIMREEQRLLNFTLLCPQLLEFGECDEPRCDSRHELTRFDFINKNDGIPCSGDIRIHILKVISPTYYAVRLLHHKPSNSTKWIETRRSSEALTFSVQLNMHYRNENNLFLHWPPHINDLCIYQYAENYRRARILEAPTFEEKGTNVVQSNLKVTLKLIDDGIIVSCVKCNAIFVCDEQFKHFPSQAVDVRLMNVVPFDNERSWDSKTTRQVQKWIIEDIKSNYVVQASVDFSLANTIWVKNVVVMEKLTGIDAYCQVVNLKKSLVEKNFGIIYNGDRKHVRDLAVEFNRLNALRFTIDGAGSDYDYQSCKNESIDLIKFSSSSDEATNNSMESAESGIEPKIENDLGGNEKKEKYADVELPTQDCENWDDNLDELVEVYDPFQISSAGKSDSPKEETWSKLALNELVKVEIGDEGENGNWENIFLQIIDEKSIFLFKDLTELINKHVEKLKSNEEMQIKIFDFEPQRNCIVKYNNLYLRAKVHGVYGENLQQRLYRFFLCDYACFTNAKSDELYNDFLYDTTEEIINFTPYQAIHCTLAGIKWDRFAKRYQVTKDYLYACAVLENGSQQNSSSILQKLSIHSYTILLYECEKENDFKNAFLFNKALVDNGITVYDEETKNFLEYEIGIEKEHVNENQSSSMGNSDVEENKDKVLTYEQLIDFIKSDAFDIEVDDILTVVKNSDMSKINNNIETKSLETIPQDKAISIDKTVLTEKLLTSNSEIDEQSNISSCTNNSKKSSISLISTDSYESLLPPPLTLNASYKRPLTTWYQNDCMIFLSIYAPDVIDYHLEITAKTILFVAEIQSEKSGLILNLLASIDTKSISHEIKGVNVIIRLKKNVYITWPRLLQQSTKYPWLKYNFNAFDSIEMEYIMPQQLLHTIIDNELNFKNQQFDNYNSDDDDNERELYQTYNPIQSNDDDCDPFSTT